MRQVGVTGPEVDRRYAQAGEPGNVRPAVFRPDLSAGSFDEGLGGGLGQARQRACRSVGLLDLHVQPIKNAVHMLQRGAHGPVGGKAVVDRHRGRVGNHIAGHPAVDAHGRQALTVDATVDIDGARLVSGQPVQHSAQLVDRVVAQPRACRMRTGSGRADHDTQRALAAGLYIAGGGLSQDRHIGGQPIRQLALDTTQTVCRRIDFLAVV